MYAYQENCSPADVLKVVEQFLASETQAMMGFRRDQDGIEFWANSDPEPE
jgi:hypothetical protein